MYLDFLTSKKPVTSNYQIQYIHKSIERHFKEGVMYINLNKQIRKEGRRKVIKEKGRERKR